MLTNVLADHVSDLLAEINSAIRVGTMIAVLSMRPIDLWSLGYPDAALADTEDALSNAREFGEAEAIDSVSILFDALPKIVLDKLDELPDRIRRDLAGTADAKISALDQLMTIMDGVRGH